MKIKQTASLKPPGCFRNVWIWAFLSCSRIFKENRPERLQVESKEPSVCVPPPGLRFGKGSFPLCSGLCPRQAEPVLRARPTAQVSVESRSELGTDQPHSLTNTFTPEALQQELGGSRLHCQLAAKGPSPAHQGAHSYPERPSLAPSPGR